MIKVILVSLHACSISRGHPSARAPGLERWLAVHEVDVFETETDRLVEEEVDQKDTSNVGADKYEAVRVSNPIGRERGEERDHDCWKRNQC